MSDMRLGLVAGPFFREHDTGLGHPECPQRLAAINTALRTDSWPDRFVKLPFHRASDECLALVHDPAYIEIVRRVCDEGFAFIGAPDTTISRWSYDVAATAVGGVLAACDAVMASKVAAAFCAVRPPGHHAECDQAMGFCLFNNVALAAEHLVRNHGLRRVAIVDVDAHHGNGTYHIFQQRADVLYVSLHQSPDSLSFPGTGRPDQTGRGVGTGYTLNVPLAPGTDGAAYCAAVNRQVVPAVARFDPEFILISAGFDGLAWDPVAQLGLSAEDYEPITATLMQLARRHARGRVVSVLEGGYDLSHLGSAVRAHLRGLSGEFAAT